MIEMVMALVSHCEIEGRGFETVDATASLKATRISPVVGHFYKRSESGCARNAVVLRFWRAITVADLWLKEVVEQPREFVEQAFERHDLRIGQLGHFLARHGSWLLE